MLYINASAYQLQAETLRLMRAADGYLYLNLPEDALGELKKIPVEEQETAAVLLARVRVLLHAKRLGDAAKLSARGMSLYPDKDEFLVQRTFVLRKLGQKRLAREVFTQAPEWLLKTGILHYNLACYEAQLGSLKDAHSFVTEAIRVNKNIEKSAKKDSDLKDLF